MSNIAKYILIAFVVIYIVSPVDLIPGPVDDFIALILLLYKLFDTASPNTKSKIEEKFRPPEKINTEINKGKIPTEKSNEIIDAEVEDIDENNEKRTKSGAKEKTINS